MQITMSLGLFSSCYNVVLMKPIYWVVVIIILVVIFGGGYWYVQSQKTSEPSVKVTPIPSTQKEQATKSSSTSGDSKVEVKVETITLKAVGGFTGSGTGTRIFTNGVFTHIVTANLDDPPSGQFYEGWLVKKQPSLKFFSTGKLVKSEGKYKLNYTQNSTAFDYPNVVITLEKVEDKQPETYVLEGSFSN